MSDLGVTLKNKGSELRSALVLGEDTRSFLSVVRSLGRAGYTVHVVCYDRTSPSLKSKYISAAYYYNYQAYCNDEWIVNVLCLIERYKYDVVFPCDERAIYPLWQVRKELPTTTKLAIANQEALDALFDKWKTKEIAIKCDVPVASGELIDLTETDYCQLTKKYGDQFVVKPLQSFEMTSLDKRNKVVIVNSERDFLDFKQFNSTNERYLVESYFKGSGEGLSVFAWKGEVKTAFSYRRLAEPDAGGGSSYRGSSELDPEQFQATERVCRETNLTGLAMFEFRRNLQSNQWILVEVNARVWGGLPLAEYAGIDFPKIYTDFLLESAESKTVNTSISHVTARALTADLYEIKRESEKISKEVGRQKAVMHMAKRLAGVMRFLSPKESIDTLRFDDPKPFVAEVGDISKNIMGSVFKERTYLTHYRRWLMRNKLRKIFSDNQSRKIIFICYGNIIRSPFAEHYFSDQMKRSNVSLDIDSFGFHPKESRQSPDIAISAASLLQCDLTNHSSKCLTQMDIKETDIVIYFDEKNRDAIESGYRVNHAFCAADLLDNAYPCLSEIDDPYESDVETIKKCYDKIKNALDNFMSIYKGAIQ